MARSLHHYCFLVSTVFLMLSTFLRALAPPVIVDDPVMFKNATWEKCRKQENAPEDAMVDFYLFKSVEGLKDHKCVVKCIDLEYGIYKEGGTLDHDMTAKVIKRHWKDPEIQDKLIQGLAKCLKLVKPDTDDCEYTYNIFDCFLNIMKENGIKIDPL